MVMWGPLLSCSLCISAILCDGGVKCAEAPILQFTASSYCSILWSYPSSVYSTTISLFAGKNTAYEHSQMMLYTVTRLHPSLVRCQAA